MRLGADRGEVGAATFATWFGEGEGCPLGVLPGASMAAARERWGEPVRLADGHHVYAFPVDDPAGNQRRLELHLRPSGATVSGTRARLISRDRMDLDAAWRPIKEHLDRVHGAPAREVGPVLVFAWRSREGFVVRASRYRADNGDQLLEVLTER
ncbi:MAG: hypothetical protein RLZZ383_2610 [Pseudomonadota bacterium]|jgi:hypothetical protein